ncbi:MAG: Chromosome partition protein Smc [Parcubacteria group bacterium GW2011_GWA2_39_18]|nr:MAG: Chromosome partition protein Smc [Parcubacteria group bacterium GW2011_GWA2_39_18]
MILKKLEISGFKSFADKHALDFPCGISAIVGPNGSGKSNIADALRWVMGDQSMKSLRAHKGEDLIYSGTNSKKSVGRASVKIVFDNQTKRFPIDFEEVVVERKIFKDGENSYFMNGSQVRLKDISQTLSYARLGLSGYTIIGQGMGDSLVGASPKERLSMIEEALGLRPLQIKKEDAQNRLKETENNLTQAQNLMVEIEPHLKFLRRQVEKLKKRDELQDILNALKKEYVLAELFSIQKSKKECQNKLEEASRELEKENHILGELSRELEKIKSLSTASLEEDFSQENEISAQREKIIMQIGQIEGALRQTPVFEKKEKFVSWKNISAELESILRELKDVSNIKDLDLIRQNLSRIINKVENFLSSEKEETHEEASAGNLKKLKEEKISLEEKLNHLNASLETLRQNRKKSQEIKQSSYLKTFSKQEEFSQQKRKVENLAREKNSQAQSLSEIAQKESNAKNEMIQYGLASSDAQENILSQDEIYNLQREIDRASARLELAQDVDPEIEKEFKNTDERFNFLSTQVEDLNKAMGSLKEVIAELEQEMQEIFDKGFEKLKEEFKKFFEIIFTGGQADLIFHKNKEEKAGPRPKAEEYEDDEYGESAKAVVGGVEIIAEIPGKRVKRVEALSGGERSLVSIALLFGIVAVSEPPFLVLDEIDAPLDENNCRKFAQILKELSQKTQFIVITHNRETMQAAGVLYGITVNEGESRILSMKLD